MREKPVLDKAIVPKLSLLDEIPNGSKQILDQYGPEGLAKWWKEKNEVMLTDTTFRDAHQSLLATRLRTKDMLKIAEETSRILADLLLVAMWGGATFDVTYSYLKEDPWERLMKLLQK